MTGVSVEFAWKRCRRKVGDLRLREPLNDDVAEFAIYNTIFVCEHVFIKGAKNNENIVVPGTENFHSSFESGPLKRAVRIDPFKFSWTGAVHGPWFVAGTSGAAERIVRRI